ncbi:MAG TPA: hypothetical protein VNH11_21840 [Pirellulales bacterium]|nr:hypothetical protein [Pirellulales bacterium]
MSRTDERECAELGQAEAVAVRHLAVQKQWQRDEYRLERRGSTKQGLAVVWAIYLQDEQKPAPGAGKSVILHIDPKQRRIVKELAFQ